MDFESALITKLDPESVLYKSIPDPSELFWMASILLLILLVAAVICYKKDAVK